MKTSGFMALYNCKGLLLTYNPLTVSLSSAQLLNAEKSLVWLN